MSFFNDIRHTPAATKPPGHSFSDPLLLPLTNLSNIQTRMETLHKFLSDSVNSHTLLGQPQLDLVSSELSSAIHHLIVNAAALLSSHPPQNPDPQPVMNPKAEMEEDPDDYEIIELDAVELLAEHVHFCEICGKGFKRDANLRMHMRAHGNQFKTPEALAKPEKLRDPSRRQRQTRFSCPYVGCNRNRQHKKFRPLKSAVCVKNHFKRSHCPKMFSCNRCNKKSFSVVADLKSHLKHCGESKWRCSCGTSFSRKDKLFGHMALFEGHMPAVVETAAAAAAAEEEDVEEEISGKDFIDKGQDGNFSNGFWDGLMLDGFGSVDGYCFQDVMNSPNSGSGVGSGMEGFFNF